MVAKFSLYDFIAVIVPGIFLMWAAQAILAIPAAVGVNFSGGLAETSVLVVVGYVVGLLAQGVSQHIVERGLLWWWGGFPSARWLLPEDKRLSAAYKEELARVLSQRYGADFGSEGLHDKAAILKRNQEVFYRCYRSIEKQSELPQTFNAQYGLFRCLFTVFGGLTIILTAQLIGVYWVGGLIGSSRLAMLGILVFSTLIAYLRTKKRSEDFTRAVLDVFLANNAPQK